MVGAEDQEFTGSQIQNPGISEVAGTDTCHPSGPCVQIGEYLSHLASWAVLRKIFWSLEVLCIPSG